VGIIFNLKFSVELLIIESVHSVPLGQLGNFLEGDGLSLLIMKSKPR
jgi:hypothetical protein